MAGFMSGFGKAFSQSFNDAADRRAKREDDMFKLTYSDYVNRRDKMDEYKREDAKRVRQAKSLTERAGQPAESWSKVYEWLSDGSSEASILEDLRTGTFEISPAQQAQQAQEAQEAAEPVSAENAPLASKAENSVDAEMEASGMGAPAKGTGLFGDLGGILPSKEARAEREQSEIYSKVGQATGVDPETVRKTLKEDYNPEPLPGSKDLQIIFKPGKAKGDKQSIINSIEEATSNLITAQNSGDPAAIKLAQAHLDGQKQAIHLKAAAAAEAKGENFIPNMAVVFDESGNAVDKVQVSPDGKGGFINVATGLPVSGNARPMTRQQSEEWTEIVKNNAKSVGEYTDRVVNLSNAIRTSDEMFKLVDPSMGGDPNILTYAADLSQIADKGVRNVIGVLDVIKGETSNLDPNGSVPSAVETQAAKAERAAIDALNSGLLDRVSQLAAKRALFEAKAIRMAYAQAAAQGQEGKGVAVSEFNMFLQSVTGNNNPIAFKQGMEEWVNSEKTKLSKQAGVFNKYNAQVMDYENRHKFTPGPLAPSVEDIMGLESKTKTSVVSPEANQMNTGIVKIQSEADYNKLPSGAEYVDPNGVKRRKK